MHEDASSTKTFLGPVMNELHFDIEYEFWTNSAKLD